ncbi:hypothetical protein EYW49_06740 [Siculibacillus lacustris]|uniref:Secreted protein n=1 Tax=Siculibacillus lacustris TaxID=1549641 RepID=A0A4Q9VT24_9HYPH|nr:hypothetical protein [Siculibacillus lacustris]TBW39187.1 hypothetical protein EYW49_06740 [Siculibacillus lacustris]
MIATWMRAGLIAAATVVAGEAAARDFAVDSSCCGVLYYSLRGDGEVSGHYPKQEGVIRGRVGPEGTATGLWTQPRSDHPCVRPRGGSYAWGRFVIYDIGTRRISGDWGYCDEIPNRGWGFR